VVPLPAEVRLVLCDATGRVVKVLDTGKKQPGLHVYRLSCPLQPGVYFVQLQSRTITICRKVVLTGKE